MADGTMTLCTIDVAQPREGALATFRFAAGWTAVAVRRGSLWITGFSDDGEFAFDIEDVRFPAPVADAPAQPRRIQLVAENSGTSIVVDGYPAWSTRARLVGGPKDTTVETFQDATVIFSAELDPSLAASAPQPVPLVQFAAPTLAERDAIRASRLPNYLIHAEFRVRGPGQYGTILAAADSTPGTSKAETLRASINSTGITVHAAGTDIHAPGSWSDGRWHHLAIRCAGGAIEVFVDGWLEAREPGTPPQFTRFTVGQDLSGQRLMGEVRTGGIYPDLADEQIALLAGRIPLNQVCIFDSYPTGAFHRIPALLRTSSGRLLAFADMRRKLPNDAPNQTDVVLSISDDDGATWTTPRTIVGFPGEGAAGVAATDCAAVEDANGTIHLLFDLYPAGFGLLNSAPGHGFSGSNPAASLLLYPAGSNMPTHAIPGGWPQTTTAVQALEAVATPDYTCLPDGTLLCDDNPVGSILRDAPLRILETAHIAVVTSPDGGATWSPLRLITNQVKEPWMTFLGIGPGNGIRLDHTVPGRLVVPCYFSTDSAKQHSCAVLFSDDSGANWQRGGSPNDNRLVNGEPVDVRRFTDPDATMTESAVVELPTGQLAMFSRSQHPFVLLSFSDDGGATWGDVNEVDQLPEIFCQPAATGDANETYFANAARMLPYRGCGTIYRRVLTKASHWDKRAVHPRHHGYQALTMVGDGVGMLWERETAGIWFTHIPRDIWA